MKCFLIVALLLLPQTSWARELESCFIQSVVGHADYGYEVKRIVEIPGKGRFVEISGGGTPLSFLAKVMENKKTRTLLEPFGFSIDDVSGVIRVPDPETLNRFIRKVHQGTSSFSIQEMSGGLMPWRAHLRLISEGKVPVAADNFLHDVLEHLGGYLLLRGRVAEVAQERAKLWGTLNEMAAARGAKGPLDNWVRPRAARLSANLDTSSSAIPEFIVRSDGNVDDALRDGLTQEFERFMGFSSGGVASPRGELADFSRELLERHLELGFANRGEAQAFIAEAQNRLRDLSNVQVRQDELPSLVEEVLEPLLN